ncbi:hypothetical protein TWF696_001560 [Orbilia brochopaga]|uniref:Uncharacterized protein n=1 Tax=Orbilia brochopaga TaxID=3140254 RepID=A0AAV9U919_9PEZI
MDRPKEVIFGEHPELRRRLPGIYVVEKARLAKLPNREEDWEDSDVEIVGKPRWPPKPKPRRVGIPPRKVKSLANARKTRKPICHSQYKALKPLPICTHEPLHSETSDWPLCLPSLPTSDFRDTLTYFNTNMNRNDPLPSQEFGYYYHPKLIKFPEPVHPIVEVVRSFAQRGFYDTSHEDAVKAANYTPDEDVSKLQKSYLWTIAAHAAQFTNDLADDQRVRAIEKYSNLALCYFLDNPGFPARYFKYYGEIKARAHYWGEIHHLQIIMPNKQIPEMAKIINHERYKRLWREYQFIQDIDRAVRVAAEKWKKKMEEKATGKRLSRFFRGVFRKSGDKRIEADQEADKENEENKNRENEGNDQENGTDGTLQMPVQDSKKLTKKEIKAGKRAMTTSQLQREEEEKSKAEKEATEDIPFNEKVLTDYFDEQISKMTGSGPGGVPTVREYFDYCKQNGINPMPGPADPGPSSRPPSKPKAGRPESVYAYRSPPAKKTTSKVIRNLVKREAKVKKDKAEKIARAAELKAEEEALAVNPCRVLIKWAPPPFPIAPAMRRVKSDGLKSGAIVLV